MAVFARGADVSSAAFGDLTTDVPFTGQVAAQSFANGFAVTASVPAQVIAFFTPPLED